MREVSSLKPEVEPVPVGPSPSSLKIKRSGRKNSITMKDVQDAASRIGMQPVYVDQINSYSVLGEHIDASGAIPIGRTMLLMAHRHLSGALQKCDELLAEDLAIADTAAILQSLQGLATAQIKAANSLIESDTRADSLRQQDAPQVMPPPARQTVVPIRTEHVTIITDSNAA